MPAEHAPLADELIQSLSRLAKTLEAKSIRYALIGGLATFLRGRPRFTQDVDVLLDVPQLSLPGLLGELSGQGFSFDTATVIREFVHEHFTSFRFGTVRIDWIKPMLPLYARTLADASLMSWTDGSPIRVATAEGLILTKLVAFRPQDQVDIETLLAANQNQIDLQFIQNEWSGLALDEESRTKWLEQAIARLIASRASP